MSFFLRGKGLIFVAMEGLIFLREVLAKIRELNKEGNAIPFDIEWCTWNKQNKSGGKLKKAEGVILCMVDKKETDAVKSLQYKAENHTRKTPNHFKNRTRNIQLRDGSICKINILLITKFNDKSVVY